MKFLVIDVVDLEVTPLAVFEFGITYGLITFTVSSLEVDLLGPRGGLSPTYSFKLYNLFLNRVGDPNVNLTLGDAPVPASVDYPADERERSDVC